MLRKEKIKFLKEQIRFIEKYEDVCDKAYALCLEMYDQDGDDIDDPYIISDVDTRSNPISNIDDLIDLFENHKVDTSDDTPLEFAEVPDELDIISDTIPLHFKCYCGRDYDNNPDTIYPINIDDSLDIELIKKAMSKYISMDRFKVNNYKEKYYSKVVSLQLSKYKEGGYE